MTDIIPDGLAILSASGDAVIDPPATDSGLYENTAKIAIPNHEVAYTNTTYHHLAPQIPTTAVTVTKTVKNCSGNTKKPFSFVVYFMDNNGNKLDQGIKFPCVGGVIDGITGKEILGTEKQTFVFFSE